MTDPDNKPKNGHKMTLTQLYEQMPEEKKTQLKKLAKSMVIESEIYKTLEEVGLKAK